MRPRASKGYEQRAAHCEPRAAGVVSLHPPCTDALRRIVQASSRILIPPDPLAGRRLWRTSGARRRREMEIKRCGSRPSGKGPADWFTGTIRIDPLLDAPAPARVAGASVTFEPGARTAWHTHPLGQTLIVTSGC